MNSIQKSKRLAGLLRLGIVFSVLMLVFPCFQKVWGQQYADTLPLNKNVVLEEFTAVHCSWCPAAHLLLDSLTAENPGRVFGVAMHPANTSYTAPYAGSPDFRRPFVDAFFSVPFATDSLKFFPGAFVNRREWVAGRRERYTEDWRTETDSILTEPSPLNIGLHVTYNAVANDYTVIMELFYTDTVDYLHTFYIFITEDSLIAEQNNGGVSYVHNHIFRESLTAQWGDSIGSFVLPGTLITDTLYFSDSASAYCWSRCHFIAMVRNAMNEEIITVNEAPVQEVLITTLENDKEYLKVKVFPNPFADHFYVLYEGIENVMDYCVRDITGRKLLSGEITAGLQNRIDFPEAIAGHIFVLSLGDGITYEILIR